MDGIDAAIIETDGQTVAAFGPTQFSPYPDELRKRLRAAIEAAGRSSLAGPLAGVFAELERDLTDAHAAAVLTLLKAAELEAGDIDVVGFHGQTIVHRPTERLTLQLGSGPQLARTVGGPVVSDFRSADVRAGGQGAPIVPIYHQVIAHNRAPLAIVNIGGVANVTFVGNGGELIAFDTGPGNAPIDDWTLRHTGKAFDFGGALAGSGQVHRDVVAAQLSDPYFAKAPPKSLDRMDFTADIVRELNVADGAATLCAFVAATLAKAREHLPEAPHEWIVCGGGRHNGTLMSALRAALDGAVVRSAEEVGWRGDFIEAEAIALLAVRSLRGLPITFPRTTGAPRGMTGGILSVPMGRA